MASEMHTPGPWRAEDWRDDIDIVGQPTWPCKRYGKLGEWTIAKVSDLSADTGRSLEGETRANARMIAAAPELQSALAELNDALDDCLCNSGIPGFDGERLGRAQKQARAALQHATGDACPR